MECFIALDAAKIGILETEPAHCRPVRADYGVIRIVQRDHIRECVKRPVPSQTCTQIARFHVYISQMIDGWDSSHNLKPDIQLTPEF
jgi:hypothetical protein